MPQSGGGWALPEQITPWSFPSFLTNLHSLRSSFRCRGSEAKHTKEWKSFAPKKFFFHRSYRGWTQLLGDFQLPNVTLQTTDNFLDIPICINTALHLRQKLYLKATKKTLILKNWVLAPRCYSLNFLAFKVKIDLEGFNFK